MCTHWHVCRALWVVSFEVLSFPISIGRWQRSIRIVPHHALYKIFKKTEISVGNRVILPRLITNSAYRNLVLHSPARAGWPGILERNQHNYRTLIIVYSQSLAKNNSGLYGHCIPPPQSSLDGEPLHSAGPVSQQVLSKIGPHILFLGQCVELICVF